MNNSKYWQVTQRGNNSLTIDKIPLIWHAQWDDIKFEVDILNTFQTQASI